MPKYETGGNNQESNPGDNKKNVKETKPEAITEQDEQDGKILSESIEKWNKKWGRKIREILEREEANLGSDAVKSLKKLAENLKTPEEIKALIDGLKDIKKAEANSESDAVKSLKKLAENLKTPEEIKALIDGLKDIGEKVKDDDLGLSKLKGEGKDE